MTVRLAGPTAAERVYAAIREEPATRRLESRIAKAKVMHLIELSFTTLLVSTQLALAVELDGKVLIDRAGYRVQRDSRAFKDIMFVYNAAIDRCGRTLSPQPERPRVSVAEVANGLLKFCVHAVDERPGRRAEAPTPPPDFGDGRRQP